MPHVEFFAHVDALVIVVAVPNVPHQVEAHAGSAAPLDPSSVDVEARGDRGLADRGDVLQLLDVCRVVNVGSHLRVAHKQPLLHTQKKQENVIGDLWY